MGRDENNGNAGPLSIQMILQVEAGHSGQRDVQD